MKKTKQILNRADCAVLVVDATQGLTAGGPGAASPCSRQKSIPYLVACNKSDLLEAAPAAGGKRRCPSAP